jgi:prolyl oligopeptidase
MRRVFESHSLITLIMIGTVATAAGAAGTTVEPAGQRLRAAIARYWDDQLQTHPLESTIFIGDHRGDDRLDDPSLNAFRAWLDRLRATRAELAAIDPTDLAPADRIDREILLTMIDGRLEAARFGNQFIPCAPTLRYPTDLHFDDLHLLFSQLGEFQAASTIGDLENFIRRLNSFPAQVDRLIMLMTQAMAEGRVPPRVVMPKVVAQLRSLANPRAEGSPLWAIIGRLPSRWSDEDRNELTFRVKHAIEAKVAPAYARLANFVEKTYIPACRASVGLSETPDGPAHYAFLVRWHTTTDLSPDQIHAIGLAEMAKNRAQMELIRRKVGFEGDLATFLNQMRTNPRFQNRTEREILDRHRAIVAEVVKNLPRLFGRLPDDPLEVRPFDPIRARSSPPGEYYPGAADGSRPGIFFVNTSEPATRMTYTMQALAYHEAVPGHHLQGALARLTPQGAPVRPFRRYSYFTAFDEGWALYSEALPAEIGLYEDPYAEFGRLNYDSLRCARLVVDTGLHKKGWSRDQSIAYMAENSSLPRNEIENEVDRYIAWPGQALAYKIGELKIREIRTADERRAGKSFDVRAFHDRLLSFGSVPLWLLERLMTESARSR